VLGNFLQEISRAINSFTDCCPTTTGTGRIGSILSIPCSLDIISLITNIGQEANIA